MEAAAARWSKGDDELLLSAVESEGPAWSCIASRFVSPPRSPDSCRRRWESVVGAGKMIKGPWTREEDELLTECIRRGITRWSEIATHIPGRVGKQCRERWQNHLSPNLNRGPFTPEEDAVLLEAVRELGTRWIEIAKRLPGRSENACKNRYNSTLRKHANALKAAVRRAQRVCGPELQLLDEKGAPVTAASSPAQFMALATSALLGATPVASPNTSAIAATPEIASPASRGRTPRRDLASAASGSGGDQTVMPSTASRRSIRALSGAPNGTPGHNLSSPGFALNGDAFMVDHSVASAGTKRRRAATSAAHADDDTAVEPEASTRKSRHAQSAISSHATTGGGSPQDAATRAARVHEMVLLASHGVLGTPTRPRAFQDTAATLSNAQGEVPASAPRTGRGRRVTSTVLPAARKTRGASRGGRAAASLLAAVAAITAADNARLSSDERISSDDPDFTDDSEVARAIQGFRHASPADVGALCDGDMDALEEDSPLPLRAPRVDRHTVIPGRAIAFTDEGIVTDEDDDGAVAAENANVTGLQPAGCPRAPAHEQARCADRSFSRAMSPGVTDESDDARSPLAPPSFAGASPALPTPSPVARSASASTAVNEMESIEALLHMSAAAKASPTAFSDGHSAMRLEVPSLCGPVPGSIMSTRGDSPSSAGNAGTPAVRKTLA